MAKIEIDLSDLGLGFDEDGDPIRGNVASQVIERAAHLIADQFRKDAEKAIQERITGVVDTEVAALVRAVLSLPIQRRTTWGERVGEPTTVLEIARERLEAFFSEPDRRDAYSRDKAVNLKGLMGDVVREAMTAELKPAIAEARTAVTQLLREQLTTAVVKNVAGS